MTPEIAKNALQFLDRVPLKGVEVAAFVEVTNALVDLAQSPQAGASKTPRQLFPTAGPTAISPDDAADTA